MISNYNADVTDANKTDASLVDTNFDYWCLYTGWSFNLVPSLYGMAVFYMQGLVLRLFNNYFENRSLLGF